MTPAEAQALFDVIFSRVIECFSAGLLLGLILRVVKRS